MSYFTPDNAMGAHVYEVVTSRRIDHVLAVDTQAGVVVRARQPIRMVGDQLDSYIERYETIHPIYGGGVKPMLFHCYGRQPLRRVADRAPRPTLIQRLTRS